MDFNYNGSVEEALKGPLLHINDGLGDPVKAHIVFKTQRPTGPDGKERDQTGDAVRNMQYAATLNLPTLTSCNTPRLGRAVIVGGAPSIESQLDKIRELSKDPLNWIFAINWAHTWLIDNGIVPNACVFFEIDSEPETVLKRAHKDCTYYICCHCSQKTFDDLKDFKRVLWHTYPNSPGEVEASRELFSKDILLVGGGVGTFTRTLSVALFLGYRHMDLFGCDSSFPDDGQSHATGYETPMSAEKDGLYVYAKNEVTGVVRRFKTLGYLALQHNEFKEYLRVNHGSFSCRVHGDSLLQWSHMQAYPEQYSYLPENEKIPVIEGGAVFFDSNKGVPGLVPTS